MNDSRHKYVIVGVYAALLLLTFWAVRKELSNEDDALFSLPKLVLSLSVLCVIFGLLNSTSRRSLIKDHPTISALMMFAILIISALVIFEGVSYFAVGKICMTYKNCPNIAYNISNYEFNMTVRLNSLGFRDSEFDLSSNNNVLLIGDSMVFGWGVEQEQTSAALLEKDLNRDVFNLGIEGAGPETYLKTLKKYSSYGNTIIMVYFSGNDIYFSDRSLKDYVTPINDFCSLTLCTVLYKAISSTFNTDTRGQVNPLSWKNLSNTTVPKKYIDMANAWQINPYLITEAIDNPDLEKFYDKSIYAFENVTRNKKTLGNIAEYTVKNNKRLIFIILPQNIIVSKKPIDSLSELGFYSTNPNSLVCNTTLHSHIKSFMSQYNITVVDLQEDMCKDSNASDNYFLLDVHMSPTGHKYLEKKALDTISQPSLIV